MMYMDALDFLNVFGRRPCVSVYHRHGHDLQCMLYIACLVILLLHGNKVTKIELWILRDELFGRRPCWCEFVCLWMYVCVFMPPYIA